MTTPTTTTDVAPHITETRRRIEVMQAAANGARIEMRRCSDQDGEWQKCTKPTWNFASWDYRVAPKPAPSVDVPIEFWMSIAPNERPCGGACDTEEDAKHVYPASPAKRFREVTEGHAEPRPCGDELHPPYTAKCWPEDASHKNGDYECRCAICGAKFYGHKRRVCCKECASKPAPVAPRSPEAREGDAVRNAIKVIHSNFDGTSGELTKWALHDLLDAMNGDEPDFSQWSRSEVVEAIRRVQEVHEVTEPAPAQAQETKPAQASHRVEITETLQLASALKEEFDKHGVNPVFTACLKALGAKADALLECLDTDGEPLPTTAGPTPYTCREPGCAATFAPPPGPPNPNGWICPEHRHLYEFTETGLMKCKASAVIPSPASGDAQTVAAVERVDVDAGEQLPEGLPPLPAPPAGHVWVYRGRDWSNPEPCFFAYVEPHDTHWLITLFPMRPSASFGHYAEAVPIEAETTHQP